ncbi:MAG: PAS domain S-box protein [Gammaproteobacteria bacterium]|nr:MAG: PAS domain S-box protein [Gammaproteobacteria bacterium]
MLEQNILMVDDRSENLIALEAILEAPGRNLIKATSGNKALGVLLKEEVSLVLLDVQMPVMDGFEVAELMRSNCKTQSVPIIFLTAISKEQQYVFKGYESGAVDYLFKPLEEPILKSKVDFFLLLDKQKKELGRSLLDVQRLQQKNNSLLNAIGEGIIGFDEDGRVTFANPVADSFLAGEGFSLEGKNFEDLFYPSRSKEERLSWRESVIYKECSEGNRYHDFGDLFCAMGERFVPVSYTATAINAPNEKFRGVVLVVQDAILHEATREVSQAKSNRRYIRKRLSVSLRVFDPSTGENLGCLENLTVGGMKLKSKKVSQSGVDYDLSMVLPAPIDGVNTISFTAKCMWSKQASFSNDFASGYQFAALNERNQLIIETLLKEF